MMQSEEKIIGNVLFGIGLILALISGLIVLIFKNPKVLMILYGLVFLFGLFTGYHNIKRRELSTYLLATLVLIVTLNQSYSLIEYIGQGLGLVSVDNLYSFLEPFSKIINSFIIFISSAAIIPALKATLKILED
jgi:hypothetical protein